MLYSEYLKNRRGYQEDGYRLLLERKHACLFYEPGKGKTYPCIDAMLDVNDSKNGNAKILVLSTADAIRNMWETDIVPQNILPKQTVLMTFTTAIQNATAQMLMKINWDIIVVDECHKIKSPSTQISKLVYKLTKKCEYAWGLTGTPRGNCDVDIFCQFHNLNVSDWGNISYTMFVENCCDIEQKFFGARHIKIPKGINYRYQAGWERNIAMYSQRVSYDEDDEMPPIEFEEVLFDYVKTKQYKDAEQGILNVGENATTMIKLAAIGKMHQAVNGYLYLEDKSIYRFEHNKKLDWLKNNVNTNDKTLIVYRHIADLEDLKKLYPNATEIVNDFKCNKSNILLLQCSRCESFNLQMCNRIIFYTLDYSFIKFKQMMHRCWRKGQNENVKVQILLFNKTIENKIWKSVETKKSIADLFMSAKEL